MDGQDIILPTHANPIVLEWIKDGKAKTSESGCWEWQQRLNEYGYGQVWHDNKSHLAHRLAINAPKELYALHSCNNRKCCNPSHLRIGNQQDNMNDRLKPEGGKYGRCQVEGCKRARSPCCDACAKCMAIRNGTLHQLIECQRKAHLKKMQKRKDERAENPKPRKQRVSYGSKHGKCQTIGCNFARSRAREKLCKSCLSDRAKNNRASKLHVSPDLPFFGSSGFCP